MEITDAALYNRIMSMERTGKTLHVYRAKDGQWSVQKAGTKSKTFLTQAAAVKMARRIAKGQSEAQVVMHESNGQITTKAVHGLPPVQSPPKKSALGTKRIAKAISNVVRQRLEAI